MATEKIADPATGSPRDASGRPLPSVHGENGRDHDDDGDAAVEREQDDIEHRVVVCESGMLQRLGEPRMDVRNRLCNGTIQFGQAAP